jgi:hypothetical protein
MSAQEILAQTNWDTEAKLEAACQYIDNQQDNGCFQAFVQQTHEETKEP